MENLDTITFIITNRSDSGFVENIYSAHNIMDYGNAILIHEPIYLKTILRNVKEDFKFRLIIHAGFDSPGKTGFKYVTALEEEFKGLKATIVSKSDNKFPNGQKSVIESDRKIFNTDFINTKAFVDQLEVYDKNFKISTSDEVLRAENILKEFGNSIQKIVTQRRKGHNSFEINDEYDVQDLLYVILKSVFPSLKCEDPIPKVGGRSTKVDLIIRGEEILIEVKMLKKSDQNELKIIEQLKIDFESYHKCHWLKNLLCFVYDPYKRTQDKSNFEDLNGLRKKGENEYNVNVILVN